MSLAKLFLLSESNYFEYLLDLFILVRNGAIEIEPGYNKETELVITDGISINRGFATHEFLANNRTKYFILYN